MRNLSGGGILALALGIGLPASIVPSEGSPGTPTKAATAQAASPERQEITVRNATKQEVRYTIGPTHSRKPAEARVLAPGGIDRFASESSLDVTYRVKEGLIVSRVDPGRSYSFRHDEHGELELFLGSHGRADAPDLAPYITTPMNVVDKMLQLAHVDANDVVYDLGCGDGRLVIQAARLYGARGVGIDIDPRRIEESRANARFEGVEDRVTFLQADVMAADFSPATVLTIYLLPESNALLRPLLERRLRPGTRVLSHNYAIPGWEGRLVDIASLKDDEGSDHYVYVYVR